MMRNLCLLVVVAASSLQIQAFIVTHNKAKAFQASKSKTSHFSSSDDEELDVTASTSEDDEWDVSQSQTELFQQLDEAAFVYEGRLPSGGQDFRCGYVCIVGAPNMGKSTLMNALIQEDLCVATR